MRVIAFSCCHLCSEETQLELYDRLLDYTPVYKLMESILSDPPDFVVNLGDFTEPLYETPDLAKLLPEWSDVQELNVCQLMGNHEAGRNLDIETHANFDGVRYEHGHYQTLVETDGKRELNPETYNAGLRKRHEGQRLVHGHTHIPYTGENGWPVDVGSVVHSQTYGEIIDGVPYIKELK